MNSSSLVVLVLLGGLLLLMFSRTRRQQREVQALQSQLTVGAQVITTAGLYATVVEIDGPTVTLETAPGQRSRWDRRAVARVVPPDPADTGPELADGGPAALTGEADAVAGDPDGEPAFGRDDEDLGGSSPRSAPPDRA